MDLLPAVLQFVKKISVSAAADTEEFGTGGWFYSLEGDVEGVSWVSFNKNVTRGSF